MFLAFYLFMCGAFLVQGITPEITRGVLSAAFMLMVKEKIHAIVKGAIIGPKA